MLHELMMLVRHQHHVGDTVTLNFLRNAEKGVWWCEDVLLNNVHEVLKWETPNHVFTRDATQLEFIPMPAPHHAEYPDAVSYIAMEMQLKGLDDSIVHLLGAIMPALPPLEPYEPITADVLLFDVMVSRNEDDQEIDWDFVGVLDFDKLNLALVVRDQLNAILDNAITATLIPTEGAPDDPTD